MKTETAETETNFPSVGEWQQAIKQAKAPPHKCTSTSIKTSDHGAGITRHFLPPKFHTLTLDAVRIACTNLSRGGNEPGKNKRTDEQKQAAILKSLINAFPATGDHTAEYDQIHASDDFRNLRDRRKHALDYRCQLCCRHFLGNKLEGHVLDYENWDQAGMMLILCSDECHPIADSLRRRGNMIKRGETVPNLLFE